MKKILNKSKKPSKIVSTDQSTSQESDKLDYSEAELSKLYEELESLKAWANSTETLEYPFSSPTIHFT